MNISSDTNNRRSNSKDGKKPRPRSRSSHFLRGNSSKTI
jgi:hypothetical protein